LRGSAGAERLPLFSAGKRPEQPDDPQGNLPLMPAGEGVVHDYRTTTLSLKGHPLSFMRPELDRRRTVRCADLIDQRDGGWVEAAGLVLVRQQPGTASGVIFATLEDETGVATIIIWPKTFKQHRKVVLGARAMAVRGKLQREGLVVHIVAHGFHDLTPRLIEIAQGNDLGDRMLMRADEGRSGPPRPRDEAERRRREMLQRQARAALPSGRNFH
jgi:error-prone DNA polymerase